MVLKLKIKYIINLEVYEKVYQLINTLKIRSKHNIQGDDR